MKNRKVLDISIQQKAILSNEKLSTYLMDRLAFPAVIINKKRILLYANKEAEKIAVIPGTHCWDTFGKQASISEEDKNKFAANNNIPADGIKCIFCKADKALKTQSIIKKRTEIENKKFEIYWIPLDNETFLHYGIEIA